MVAQKLEHRVLTTSPMDEASLKAGMMIDTFIKLHYIGV